jgi:putative PIN family toxin of toxin-antitoxin system
MKVVADTNIVVSGLLWRGNPRLVLEAARDGRIDLFTSGALLDELDDVLLRERFSGQLRAAGVEAHELVLGYGALAQVIEPGKIDPVVHDDPDDDAVIACAVFSRSEIIVSGDSHLLKLKQHQNIRVVTAAEFIKEISLAG